MDNAGLLCHVLPAGNGYTGRGMAGQATGISNTIIEFG